MEAALSIETHLPRCVIVAHNTTHLIQSVQCFSFWNIIILLIWGRFCSFITRQVMFQIDTAGPLGTQRQTHISLWMAFFCEDKFLSHILYSIKATVKLPDICRMFFFLSGGWPDGWSLPVCFFFFFLHVFARLLSTAARRHWRQKSKLKCRDEKWLIWKLFLSVPIKQPQAISRWLFA